MSKINEEDINYEIPILIAKGRKIYDKDMNHLFTVPMTFRAKELLNNEGWIKNNESWISYRQRTEKERCIEERKSEKFAKDLAEFYNRGRIK